MTEGIKSFVRALLSSSERCVLVGLGSSLKYPLLSIMLTNHQQRTLEFDKLGIYSLKMPLNHGTWGNVILSADSFFIHCSLVTGGGRELYFGRYDFVPQWNSECADKSDIRSSFHIISLFRPSVYCSGVVEGALGWGVDSDFWSLLRLWLAVCAQAVP